MIDSEFIENSIAMLSVKMTEESEQIIESSNAKIYYLFDNDAAGKKASIKKIQEGKFVFNWVEFLNKYNIQLNDMSEIKDFNDIVCKKFQAIDTHNKFKFEDLKDYFTNSVYDIPLFNV